MTAFRSRGKSHKWVARYRAFLWTLFKVRSFSFRKRTQYRGCRWLFLLYSLSSDASDQLPVLAPPKLFDCASFRLLFKDLYGILYPTFASCTILVSRYLLYPSQLADPPSSPFAIVTFVRVGVAFWSFFEVHTDSY